MLLFVRLSKCRHGLRGFGLVSRPLGASAAGRGPLSRGFHHDTTIEDIRNVGIIAHVDAGKTTTTERMLYYSGASRHLGNVDHGDTITDFLPMERDRGITIQSAAISFHWPLSQHCPPGIKPKTINLIDTPGHQDFRFEVDRCMPILDGAICIIDSVKGVEAHTERVWASAHEFKIPRIVYINKLDRDGASFKKSVLDIASRLNAWPLVCQIPLWDKDKFVGVVDIIRCLGYRWNSLDKYTTITEAALRNEASLWEEIETARSRLIEKLCDEDDVLLEDFTKYGTEIPLALIRASIHRVVIKGDGAVVPIFAGSSLRNMGVQPLLDAIVDYLPNPREAPVKEAFGAHVASTLSGGGDPSAVMPGTKGTKQKGGRIQNEIGGVASVFKVVNDSNIFPGVRGMLTFVRIYNGVLHTNSRLSNLNLTASAKPEKPMNLLQISAAKTSQIPHLGPGQIGAIAGLKEARTGDTLVIWPSHSHHHKLPDWTWDCIKKRPLEIAPAVAFLSMEPYTISETQALEDALKKMEREDPSLRWSKDDKSGSFTLSGMGKLHLEIAVDRLKTNYKVKAFFSEIQVDYKESLKSPTGLHRFVYDRAVASKAGKAACTASVEPLGQHQSSLSEGGREHNGNVYCINIRQRADESSPHDNSLIREQLFNGACAAMARGPRRSFPMQGCHVDITFDLATDFFGPGTDGHIVQAASHAVRTALNDAHSKEAVGFLEPVMMVNIHCPEDASGAIQHDISSARGGHVLEVRDGNTASQDSNIDVSKVYAPPDPYESLQSLRDPKKGVTRMLELVAKVPLKEMLDYDSHMRSKTGGRHSFNMELHTFQMVVGPREKNLI